MLSAASHKLPSVRTAAEAAVTALATKMSPNAGTHLLETPTRITYCHIYWNDYLL